MFIRCGLKSSSKLVQVLLPPLYAHRIERPHSSPQLKYFKKSSIETFNVLPVTEFSRIGAQYFNVERKIFTRRIRSYPSFKATNKRGRSFQRTRKS